MGGVGIDWVSAIVVLAVGLVLGGLFVWRMRAAGGAAPPPGAVPLEQRDLLAQRDALLGQLAELDETAAKRNPEQLARERYDLELQTARVVRELDRQPAPVAEPAASASPTVAEAAPAVAPPAAGSPALRGFLWGTGSVAALAGLVFLVTQAARPREPGGSPTGELPGASSSAPADAEEAQIQAVLEQNPDDLDARLALAHLYLGRQDMMGVWNETQYVLARSPGHPRALSYQSLVRLAMGQPEIALDMLQQAIAADPDMVDAYVPLSLVQMRLGQTEASERTMAEAKRRFPQQAEALARFEREMRASAGEGPAVIEGDPHAAVPRPEAATTARAAAPPSGSPAAASPARAVGGRLDLDPGLREKVAGGVIFLIVREAGVEAGPPLAVQRLVPTSFPLRFQIGEADSMTGAPLPDTVLIEARLDADGDAATRSSSEPRARADGVRVGTSDLQLVLRPGS